MEENHQNYKQKMKQAYNRVNDAKRDYSKAILDRINLISLKLA